MRVRPGQIKHYVIIGFLLGFIIALKYTFAIVLIAVLIDFLFFKDLHSNKLFKKLSVSILSIIFSFFIFSIVLFDPEVFNGYLQVLKYLSSYASYQHLNLALIKESLVSIGNYFGDNYSLTLFSLSVLGLFYYVSIWRILGLDFMLGFRVFVFVML